MERERSAGLLRLCSAAVISLLAAQAGAAIRGGPTVGLRAEARWDEDRIDGEADGAGMVQPGFGWWLRDPTTSVDVTWTSDLVGYARGRSTGGVNHRLLAAEEFRLDPRTTLRLGQAAERVYDPTALRRAGVVRAAGTTTWGEAELELEHRLSPRWNVGTGYRGGVALLEAREAIDGAVHAPSGFASFALGPHTTATLRYRFQIFDSFRGRDASSHDPAVGWIHRIGPGTRIELEAGPALFAQEGERRIEPIGAATLHHRTRRLELHGRVERGLVGSTGFDGAILAEILGAAGGYRIAGPLRIDVALGLFRNGRAGEGAPFAEGFASEVGVEWRIDRYLAAELAWRRVEQLGLDSAEAIDLSRSIFALGLSWRFQGGRLPR